MQALRLSRRPAPARRDDTAEGLKLIADIAELGCRDVGLIGGEAYLRKDWLQLIAAVRANGMDCTLQTGGRNMSEERVAAAAAAGLQGVGVSIDGLREVHDELRGVPGSFELAMAALKRVTAHGMAASVNTQINAKSMPQCARSWT